MSECSTLLYLAPIKYKTCNKCNQNVELSLYAKNKANKDGLQNTCKACDNIRQQKRRIEKKAEIAQYHKNRRKLKSADFKFRLQGLLNASRARAREKNLEHTLTMEDLYALYPPDNKCPVFNLDLKWNGAGFRDNSPSLDRIIPELGYIKENVQIISFKANRIKGYATVEELETVVNYLRKVG